MVLGLSWVQLLVIFTLLVSFIAIGWLYLSGDTEDDMVDDPPTLNTRGKER